MRVLSESPNGVFITLRPYMPLEPRYPPPPRDVTGDFRPSSRKLTCGTASPKRSFHLTLWLIAVMVENLLNLAPSSFPAVFSTTSNTKQTLNNLWPWPRTSQ